MKNLVRAFVLALTFTGAVAAAHSSTPDNETAKLAPSVTFSQIPTCPPNDPHACHIHDGFQQ